MLNGWSPGKHFILDKFFLFIMLVLCSTLQASSIINMTGNELTDKDKSEIIKFILEQELKAEELKAQKLTQLEAPNLPKGFKTEVRDSYLSTENIAFFHLPTNLAARLKSIKPEELRAKRRNREIFECFIFKVFTVEDARVIVKLWIMQPSYTFGGYWDLPQEVRYEFRKVSERWEGKLIKN